MNENSNIALEKLRVLIAEYEDASKKLLPTIADLAKMFGVGQRAVRRALSVLEAEGLLEVTQGVGVTIGAPIRTFKRAKSPLKFESIVEVMQVRFFFEPHLCRLAATNMQQTNISRLLRAQQALTKAEDMDEAELWDGTFHREIAIATNSPLLLSLFDQINLIRKSNEWREVRNTFRDTEHMQRNHNDHQQILSALIQKDGAKAADAMEAHIGRLLGQLISKSTEG